jgi:hypothetical protein
VHTNFAEPRTDVYRQMGSLTMISHHSDGGLQSAPDSTSRSTAAAMQHTLRLHSAAAALAPDGPFPSGTSIWHPLPQRVYRRTVRIIAQQGVRQPRGHDALRLHEAATV